MLNNSTPNATGVQTFSFDHDTNVEVVIINNEPYFVAADVCRALGLINPTDHIVKSLDDDEHLTYKIYRAGQQRLVNLITESGLYALVVRSTKPNARKFRKWVTSEVLPAIRKTGKYEIKQAEPAKKAEPIKKQKYDYEKNAYYIAIRKACETFLNEERKGWVFSELRLAEKLKAARTLYTNEARELQMSTRLKPRYLKYTV